MQAIILTQPGGVEQLQYAELPTPTPAAGEVLIRVKAISINPVDMKTRKGMALYQRLKDAPPIILGWDISGVVESCGADAKKYKKGDEVFGMINFPGHGKAYAEYVCAPETHLALKPAHITHPEAAAATLAALTAWQGLTEHGGLKAGQKLLIHAAAGGVGHYAIQFAKSIGAYVIGTASARNKDFVLQLGADEHFDYTSGNFEEKYHDLDMVLDGMGGEIALRSLEVLKPGGIVVCLPSGASLGLDEKAKEKGLRGKPMMVYSDGKGMGEIAAFLAEGKLKSHLAFVYHWNEMRDAHSEIEQGRTRGKIVVLPPNESKS